MRLRAVAGLLLLMVIALLVRSDYGFYRPDVGMAAAGREETQNQPHQREVLRLSIGPEDLQRFGKALTVKRLSEFYGVVDSVPCSVRYTFSSTESALPTRRLRAGQVVSLCLN